MNNRSRGLNFGYEYRPYKLEDGSWCIAEYRHGKLVAHTEHVFHTLFEARSWLRRNNWPILDAQSAGYSYGPLMLNGWWTIGEYLHGTFQNHVGEFYTSKEEVEHFLSTHNWPRRREGGE